MLEFQTHILKNGIKLIHKFIPNVVAHCGLIVNAGSRDESDNEHGLAHFIEHVLFKGTNKRKAHHILTRLEDVGGEINAYTTKEETCVYASFMRNDYEKALELISDIVFNSVFPDKELTKEKEVIIDEINSYKDNPSELIFDDFEELIFPDNSLGKSILGTKQQLKKYNRNNIKAFIDKNYNTTEMVISSIGNIEFKSLIKIVEKHFSGIPESNNAKTRIKPLVHKPYKKFDNKKTYQAHIILGAQSYNFKHKNRQGMYLLNNLLGGPGLSSRLNMALREKNGYSYNIESNYSAYSDTGIFSTYFGTEKNKISNCIELALKEFQKLRDKPLGIQQLKKAKKQLLGQIAISSENYESLMLNIGKSYLVYNKVDTFNQIAEKIENISSQHIQNIANEMLNPDNLSYIVYK